MYARKLYIYIYINIYIGRGCVCVRATKLVEYTVQWTRVVYTGGSKSHATPPTAQSTTDRRQFFRAAVYCARAPLLISVCVFVFPAKRQKGCTKKKEIIIIAKENKVRPVCAISSDT